MYVSKFEKKIPTEEIAVVIAVARGQATKKEGISAGLYALGCATEYLPDSGPQPMGAAPCETDEDAAAALEAHLPAMSASGDETKAVPWALLIPVIQFLLSRWFKG